MMKITESQRFIIVFFNGLLLINIIKTTREITCKKVKNCILLY